MGIADCRADQEVRKLDGTLTIDDDGQATLITAGFVPLLEPVAGRWQARTRSASALVVHGRLNGGRRMTLLRVSGNTPTVRAKAVIEGMWLDPGRPADLADVDVIPANRRAELIAGEDVKAFSGIEVEIEHLGTWAAAHTLHMGVPRQPQHDPVPLVTRVQPATLTATLPDETVVSLRSMIRQQPYHRACGTSFETSETTTVRIATPGPASLNTLLCHVSTVRRLVGFALRRDVGVLGAALIPADPNVVDAAVAGRENEGDVLVSLRKVFLPIGHRNAPAVKPHRMLFTQADLPFADIMPRWAAVSEDLRGTVASLTAAHNQESLLETRLAAATTAAENLFACTHRGNRTPRIAPDEFTRLRKVLLDAIAQHPDLAQYEQFVRECLQNRAALRKRLERLVDDLGEPGISLLSGRSAVPSDMGNSKEVNSPADDQDDGGHPPPQPSARPLAQAWAWAAVKGRNEVAHQGVTTLDINAALTTLQATTALVELLVLRALGFPDARLAALIDERHYRLAQHIQDHVLPRFQEVQSGAGDDGGGWEDDIAGDATSGQSSDAQVGVLEVVADDDLAPLITALVDTAGTYWRRGWVPWRAVITAAQRRGALPADAVGREELTRALEEVLGRAAPQLRPGRKPTAGPGYSTLDLLIAVNDHHHAVGWPIPSALWRRHPNMKVFLDVLKLAVDHLGDPNDPMPDLDGLAKAHGVTVTADHREPLTRLLTEHPDRIRAWFPPPEPSSDNEFLER